MASEPADATVSVKEGDIVVNGRYVIGRLIGTGSFGKVFLARDKWKDEQQVAVKVEKSQSSYILRPFSYLSLENMVLTQLKGGRLNQHSEKPGGFPNVHCFQVINSAEQILVMDLLGPSLLSLFKLCDYKFTIKTVLLILDQLLYRIQILHEKGYIHRDLKPANILMGATGKSKDVVHLIDFGLSKMYWTCPQTKEHMSKKSCKYEAKRVGTARYMSARGESLQPVSRRDDLESVAYIAALFLRGSLPWQDISGSTSKQQCDKIVEMKMSLTPAQLFEGFPYAFVQYLKNVKMLQFYEEPNYSMYRKVFREHGKLLEIQYSRGGQFDWLLVENEEERRKKRKCNQKIVSLHRCEAYLDVY